MQIRSAGADAAAGGSAEGHDGLAVKVVALQEGVDGLGRLAPPDGISQEHHIVVLHVGHAAGDGRSSVSIVLLPAGAAVGVVIIQVGGGVGILGEDLIEVSVQNGLQMSGDVLCVAGGGEIGHQHPCLFIGSGGGRRLPAAEIIHQDGRHLGAGGVALGGEAKTSKGKYSAHE